MSPKQIKEYEMKLLSIFRKKTDVLREHIKLHHQAAIESNQRYCVYEPSRNEAMIIIIDYKNQETHCVTRERYGYRNDSNKINEFTFTKHSFGSGFGSDTYIDNPFEIDDINVDTDILILNVFSDIVQHNQSLNKKYVEHLDKLIAVKNK